MQLKYFSELIGPYEIIAVNEKGYGKGISIFAATKMCKTTTKKKPRWFFIAPAGVEILDQIISYPQTAKWQWQEL